MEACRLAECHGAHERNYFTVFLGRDVEIALQKVLLGISFLEMFSSASEVSHAAAVEEEMRRQHRCLALEHCQPCVVRSVLVKKG